ncbi:colorectal mutant cancer protein-like isoform X1 [Haliotis cracherodii]|uniref:colorectal mutant cancer protein-like isoform X1 n=1 Tax=Haliotis cracherodii TaxID=6455 RepID=UPI0039E8A3D6
MAANSKGDADTKKSPKVGSCSDSDSSNTSEEERLRRLFQTCDADGDGFIDGDDFIYMCSQLNMEDSAQEIMAQLGVNTRCQISFSDFLRCRSRVMLEAEQCPYIGNAADDTGIDSDTSGFQVTTTQNITSWPTMSSDSIGAHSGKPESVDYDSGARDLCSPEPASLSKLMESHDPGTIKHMTESCSAAGNFLELANRLHLAALTSLKGEIIDLNNRLQHVTSERDLLEKQLTKVQSEKLHLQHECEDRIDQTAGRYEERITELHSVIAELRKKIERHQINVIREEDEFEESDKSNDGGSINENNANGSQSASCEIGNEINAEFTRVVTELESAIAERKEMAIGVDDGERDAIRRLTQDVDNDSVDEKAGEICEDLSGLGLGQPPTLPPRQLRPAMFHPPPPPPPNQYPDPEYLQEEIASLRVENNTLQEQIGKQEVDLNMLREHLEALRDEREKLKRKVREMQSRIQVKESSSSPNDSRTSTPTKSQLNQSQMQMTPSNDQFPVAKIAELKKLKTCAGDRQVLGSEISSLGLPNTKVAEHLVQSLQECSNMQEIVQTLYKCGSEIGDTKVKEFEIEFERLQSKIDNLKSQHDLNALTLSESKAYSERLTVLMGKYESNNTALNLAINYSDQAIEAYEVLCALLETEMGVLLSNCRAAGLGSLAGDSGICDDQNEVTVILQRSHHARKTAENVAKHLLHKMERCCTGHVTGCTASPWEDLSSNSRTASTTSSTASSVDTDFSKIDEQRLRDYIQSLKNDRAAVKMTVLELESVHIDPMSDEPKKMPEAQRLDLENAVLMQELMAMKEEKAELKAGNYLMEKEKRALELRLSGKESQEQAYRVQIEHLKCEVLEHQQKLMANKDGMYKKDIDCDMAPMISMAELRTNNSSDIAQDLCDALKREKKLKSRVQELVSTLEKISRNSEIRHQQSAEFVNDLKRANSALISAFDKAKKKYQSKLKKLETQLQSMTERYETQIRMLKQRISMYENDGARPPTNETSL